MSRLPEGRLGQLLAIGLGVLIAFAVYFGAVAPIVGAYEARAQTLQDRLDQADRLRGEVADLPRVEAALADWRARYRDADLLLTARSDAMAAAALQTMLKDLAARSDAILASVSSLPPEPEKGLQRVGIHATLSGDLPLLASVLRAVEAARPLLFVDNLEIQGGGDKHVGDADGSDAEPTLAIAFDVYGLRVR